MRFDSDFLSRYLEIAPAALAIERSLECEILARQRFTRPILDLGCGDGIFAFILCAEEIETGVDHDPAEVARARIYDRYEELITCSADAVPKPDASYRTIVSNSVLEHIPDLLPVLREQRRLLTPDGRLYVTVPTDRWEQSSLIARTIRSLALPAVARRYASAANSFWRHFHAYPEARWTALFAEAGFTVVGMETYDPANLTTLLDVLSVFAAPALLNKTLIGRWIALPRLRKLTAPVIQAALIGLISRTQRGTPGNLVFFALEK